jgi:ABC-type branched-subunit amino acid transport system substrate-binding protein
MVRRRAAAVLLASLLLAACGTRLPDSEFAQTSVQGSTVDNGTTGRGSSTGDLTTDGGDDSSADAGSGSDASSGSSNNAAGGGTGASSSGGAVGASDEGPNTASDIGITATTITIGNITAENGVLGDAFAPAVRGIRAWAAAVNAAGGIHGRKIVLKTCDDREDRNRDLQCAQQLVERDKVFALVGTNSRAFGGSAQYLADHEVPVLGFPITNSFYRYPTFFSIYQNGYARDGKTVGVNGNLLYPTGVFRWFKQNLNITKGAVFEYDIDESKQAGQGFAKGMKMEGFDVTEYTVSFAAPSFDSAVAQMQREGTQIIFDTMDDGANRKLCDAMERRKFSVKAKVSTIVAMGDSVGNNYNDTCRNNVYIPSSTKNYMATSVPEIAKFREAYKRYQPGLPVHQWALESWVLGQLMRKYVDTASPTRKGLVKYLNGLVAYNGDGLHVGLDWGKTSTTATRIEQCFAINRWLDSAGGWTEATNKFPFCYPDAYQFSQPALEQGN